MSVHVAEIRDRLAGVNENIQRALQRSGRGEEQVRILVATKYYDPEQLSALAHAGFSNPSSSNHGRADESKIFADDAKRGWE